MKRIRIALLMSACISGGAIAGAQTAPTAAQSAGVPSAPSADERTVPPSDSGSLMSDIIVTAQKKNRGEAAQTVPIALTAVSGAQMQAMHVVTLRDLGTLAPNVALEPNGSTKGLANFTIRGLGANSITASLEPTVGLFVNGIYQGVNGGIILDMFDVESVEILRGPQGTLFGRNVTGGAVVLRTARPTNDFKGEIDASVESGPNYNIAGTVGGAIVPDKVLLKLTGYYRRDEGWFHNDTTDSKFGKERTWFVRPTVVLKPFDNVTETLIYEHLHTTGDGPAIRNLFTNPKPFQLTLNYPGFALITNDSITSETNIKVGFGHGTITNLFGYRKLRQGAGRDTDGTPRLINQGQDDLRQHQYSNELRYAGNFFDRWDLTVGAFYFTQHLDFIERRDLGPPIAPVGTFTTGGGTQSQDGFAFFTQSDVTVVPNVIATVGLRYSYETKEAHVARISTAHPCAYPEHSCIYTLPDALNNKDHWHALTPKLGLRWQAERNLLLYADYAKGVRSGGFNLRRTAATDPGKFDQEKQDTYEVGIKSDLFHKTLRANFAGYYNKVYNMQRDANIALNGSPVTVLFNAADAEIYGAEAEFIWAPVKALEITANGGYTHGRYTKIFTDLSGDNKVTAADYRLKIPRLAPWSFNVGATYTVDLGNTGDVALHADYGYREHQAQNEANTTEFNAYRRFNASITFDGPDRRYTISAYVKNLFNREQNSASVPLIPGVAYYYTIDKGRILGLSGAYKF